MAENDRNKNVCNMQSRSSTCDIIAQVLQIREWRWEPSCMDTPASVAQRTFLASAKVLRAPQERKTGELAVFSSVLAVWRGTFQNIGTWAKTLQRSLPQTFLRHHQLDIRHDPDGPCLSNWGSHCLTTTRCVAILQECGLPLTIPVSCFMSSGVF